MTYRRENACHEGRSYFFSIHSPLETGGMDLQALPLWEGQEQDDQAGRKGTAVRSLSCSFLGKA